MKGLGIVLEESESPNAAALSPSPSISESRHKDHEALLPPLPDADPDAIIATPVVPQLLNSPTASHMGHLPSRVLQQDGEDPFIQPPSKPMADIFSELLLALYDLDLLALADGCTPTLAFPTVELSSGLALARSQTPVLLLPTVNTGISTLGPGAPGLIGSTSCTNVNSIASGAVVLVTCSSGCMAGCANCSHQPQTTTSTLPLKRLKSLKMGIRKLSLPKLGGSLSLLPTPVVELTPQLVRPVLLPLHTDINLQDDTLLSLAGGSLRLSTFSASMAYTGLGAGISTTVSTPGAPTHGYSSSGGLGLGLGPGLALFVAKQRQRASLNPTLTPQATVTVLGNLGQPKKNLQDLEQIFLRSLAEEASASDSATSPLSPNASSIHQLSTSDELIEFLMFLNEHKKSVESAFEMAKQRFTSSGWCLNHDIVNLELQRDTSLSLIDTKLLQIEERLNSEFNLLMLNNPCMRLGLTWMASTSESAPVPVAVPSSLNLKTLESKCYAREAANGVRENAFA